mmetsp:Transcript_9454/g.20526  ORF Transcript_9454/g.20526 Transcript_9454/m.20526 type:complete len:227 (+) Transcript_9454:21-701(+)
MWLSECDNRTITMDLLYLASVGLDVYSIGLPDADAKRRMEDGSEDGRPTYTREEFRDWLGSSISDGVLGMRFPDVCRKVCDVVYKWRSTFPGHLWARLSRDGCSTLIKEAREAIPVIEFVSREMDKLDPSNGPVTFLDLCSGLGFLGMLLIELLPASRVSSCILMDQAWPLKGAAAPPVRKEDGGEGGGSSSSSSKKKKKPTKDPTKGTSTQSDPRGRWVSWRSCF